ncbi:hypothetical protein CDAR_225371 [Caerostris darwini]|uniref:Transposase n=1 Tax=Caerostris darwini TaxID=1538125 RepID=A0AAV4SS10_9ARAC|nr:hypothetical protein CDAR_225371 [Caerostris darwini]
MSGHRIRDTRVRAGCCYRTVSQQGKAMLDLSTKHKYSDSPYSKWTIRRLGRIRQAMLLNFEVIIRFAA